MSKEQQKIRVIGCGNELAGDDGAGIAVARQLREKNTLPGSVEIMEAGVPGLALVELMLGAARVILVDACLGGTPGQVKRFTEGELPRASCSSGQTHGIGLREALAFARGVAPGRAPGEIIIIGIEITQPRRWVEGLSAPVRIAVAEAAARVKAEILHA